MSKNNHSFSNMQEIDTFFFDQSIKLFGEIDPLFAFNDSSSNGQIFEILNKVIKHYMVAVNEIKYFDTIRENKEYFKSLKKTRRNLGENKGGTSTMFKTILSGIHKGKNYVLEMKSICPIEILYDSLVRDKAYKIPNEIELKYVRLVDLIEESAGKIVYEHGTDVEVNMIPMKG